MVARYGERHSISLEEGGYPPLVGVGEGIFGASHGYYGMGIHLYVCVCDVKEGQNWGSRYVQDSTAGSCHSLTLSPMYPPQNKKSRLHSVSYHFRDRQKGIWRERQDKRSCNFLFPLRTQFKRLSIDFLDFGLHGKTGCLLSPLINKARQ